MNKGSYIIREIMKRIDNDSKEVSPEEQESNCTNNSPQNGHNPQKEIVLQKKEKNAYKRIFKLIPSLPNNYIYRLFGVIGINEKAIKNPGYEESFFFTYFQERVIERVEFYEHAVVLQLTAPSLAYNQPGLQYLIEKYKSQGDLYFYQLATLIEETTQLLKSMAGAPPEEKPESVKKWLDFLGDSMYVVTLGMKKVGISKALLTYLEYDIEEFAVQCIKYRSVFNEFFSSISYKAGLIHCIKNIKNTVLLSQGKISLTEYRDLTTFRFSDFIYSKNNIKSFADMSFSLLNPSFFLHKINFIYYKGEQSEKRLCCEQLRLALQDQKQKQKQSEYRTIKKIKTIPNILLKENHKLVATYKTIRNDSEDTIEMKNQTDS